MEPNFGRIVTFYSYKGGTGRSMALANFAWILAASGKKVLVIDWDLEAPGLHRYFRPFLVDPDLFETGGLIDSFWDFATSSISQATSGKTNTDPKRDELAAQALDENKRRLNWDFITEGYIDFICAGKQDATYSQRVNTFDWKHFYELGGPRLISLAKAHMRSHYHWVLIDSRTGVSDTSGICTMEMPDTVVACFTLNRQSIEGVHGILGSIRDFRSSRVDGSKITFYPLATRIENAESDRLEVARSHARSLLASFLPKAFQDKPRDYWDRMEIAYRPSYAFEEVLAAFGDATGAAGASDTMLAQVEKTGQCIAGDDKLRMPEILDQDREQVLAKYSFVGKVPRRSQPAKEAEPKETSDAGDREFLRGVLAKEQVWRASEFYWNFLLSRRELDLIRPEDQKGFGRNMTYFYEQSQKMQQLLARISVLSLGAAILSLVIGFCIPFFLTPYYHKAASGSQSTAQSGDQVKVETGIPIGLWMTYLVERPWYLVPRMASSALFAFCLLCGILALGLTSKKPYRLRTSRLILLLLMGPLRKDIPDYDPKRAPPSVTVLK